MSRDETPRPAAMAARQIDGMRGPVALRTSTLPALLSDCTQRLGFVCEQQVPGVWALVTHGSLAVQLWACGAQPGRWERLQPRDAAPLAQRAVVRVGNIKRLFLSLRASALAAGTEGGPSVHGRFVFGLQPAPWGGWWFSVRLGEHVLQCEEPAGLQAAPAQRQTLSGRGTSRISRIAP